MWVRLRGAPPTKTSFLLVFFPALLCKATLSFKEALQGLQGLPKEGKHSSFHMPWNREQAADRSGEAAEERGPSPAQRWGWHARGTPGLAHLGHAGLGTPDSFWHSWLVFTPTPTAAPAPRPGHGSDRPGSAALPEHGPSEEFCSQEAESVFYRNLPLGKVVF